MATFELIESTHRVELDDTGRARVSVTVTNLTDDELRATVALVPVRPGPHADWIDIDGDATRRFRPGGQQTYAAEIVVPQGAAVGDYEVRWNVRAERNPDRERLDGQPISFSVREKEEEPAPPPKPFPWWIPATAAGVVAAAVLTFVLWPEAEVPSLIGLTPQDAQALLRERGWVGVPQGESKLEGAKEGSVSKQEPPAGEVPKELEEMQEVRFWIQPADVSTGPTPPPEPTPSAVPTWVGVNGGPVPANAVSAGSEPGRANLYVCRGPHRGGVHPGKVIGNRCNIGYGGQEIALATYEVLTANANTVSWARFSGRPPVGAISGGQEPGRPQLYVCRGAHNRGTHPGKLVGGRCNIGWGGKEVELASFDILMSNTAIIKQLRLRDQMLIRDGILAR